MLTKLSPEKYKLAWSLPSGWALMMGAVAVVPVVEAMLKRLPDAAVLPSLTAGRKLDFLAKAMACLVGVRRTLRVAAVCAVAAELAIRAAAKAV